jgi:hypothetical protein
MCVSSFELAWRYSGVALQICRQIEKEALSLA